MSKFFDLFRDHRTPEERAMAAERRSNKLSKKEGSSPRPLRKDEKRRADSVEMFRMMEDLTIAEQNKSGFVGGFQPRPSPSPGASAGGASTSSAPAPGFPVPLVSPPSPGPLPNPPRISMPTPQTYAPYAPSLTMQYATGARRDVLSLPHSPPPAVPTRPISAPGEERRRPRLEMDINAVPTPPPINRARSEPPTPVSAGAKARKSGRRASDAGGSEDSDVENCGAITKAGKRCKNKVRTPAALDIVSPSPDSVVVRFCKVHQKEWLTSATGFYSKKEGATDQWVEFDVYIPEHLQPDTKAALRVEMEKARSASDVPGYIYAFEIRDPDAPGVFDIKVGRAVNLNKRVDQWSKQCGSKEQALRGWWPGSVDAGETSLLKGRIVAGKKGACCHRLERLIHIELADIVLHQPHYHLGEESDEESKSRSKKARLVRPPKEACADCDTVHKEIFSFERPKGGKYVGKEWEKLVKPVIERWGRFVELYV